MEKNGLLIEMGKGVADLAAGRRALYTSGTEADGLRLYQRGFEKIFPLFVEARKSLDPELMILAELFYTSFELAESRTSEPLAVSNAQAAIRMFEEALEVLKIVQDPEKYKIIDKGFSSSSTYRYETIPKDAFHVACLSECARIRDSLNPIGLSEEVKQIADARIALMVAARKCYLGLQKTALA